MNITLQRKQQFITRLHSCWQWGHFGCSVCFIIFSISTEKKNPQQKTKNTYGSLLTHWGSWKNASWKNPSHACSVLVPWRTKSNYKLGPRGPPRLLVRTVHISRQPNLGGFRPPPPFPLVIIWLPIRRTAEMAPSWAFELCEMDVKCEHLFCEEQSILHILVCLANIIMHY